MLLVIDVGNTQTAIGVYEGESLDRMWRVATNRDHTADELRVKLLPLLQSENLQASDITGAALASVVPQLTGAWTRAVQDLAGVRAVVCSAKTAGSLFDADYPNPREIGADRIADCVAAHKLYGAPVVVVDFGTATNMEVIDEKGTFAGGVIAPGVDTSARALFSHATKLGAIDLVNPHTSIGRNTAQAMQVEQKAAEVGLCDVNQTVSITENFDGVSIDHLKTLPASVKFITEDGHGVQDNATMAKAFAICTQKDITVMSHAEDMEISPWDYRLAEDIETVRNCWLSEYYQTRLHMCHVSTRGALDAIQMAKLRGAPVTCEVTPHHLWFTNDTCDYRVNPPIRTADDVQALVDGIRSGIVDAIATDHAPHSEEDKLKGMAGMVGSETAFGVCYTKLCKQEGLPLEVLVHLMSTRPAEILGLAKGQLEPGYDADFVLVDLDTPYTVDKDKLHSKSHNTPFDGVELYGKVCATIKGGKITYQAEA